LAASVRGETWNDFFNISSPGKVLVYEQKSKANSTRWSASPGFVGHAGNLDGLLLLVIDRFVSHLGDLDGLGLITHLGDLVLVLLGRVGEPGHRLKLLDGHLDSLRDHLGLHIIWKTIQHRSAGNCSYELAHTQKPPRHGLAGLSRSCLAWTLLTHKIFPSADGDCYSDDSELEDVPSKPTSAGYRTITLTLDEICKTLDDHPTSNIERIATDKEPSAPSSTATCRIITLNLDEVRKNARGKPRPLAYQDQTGPSTDVPARISATASGWCNASFGLKCFNEEYFEALKHKAAWSKPEAQGSSDLPPAAAGTHFT
jgi:hypothetical protein